MSNEPFDPVNTLLAIKQRRAMQRRRQYRKSRLEKFRAEIVSLKKAGASSQDIVTWLRMDHRVKIHRSSFDRYLSTLPEIGREKPGKSAPTEGMVALSVTLDSEVA